MKTKKIAFDIRQRGVALDYLSKAKSSIHGMIPSALLARMVLSKTFAYIGRGLFCCLGRKCID